ncbi:MAG TPA: ferritin-like domain-containing protein [Stellaceae bacterium]|nr:ferritin-like domain-containing protein [Stellaceae bacterium]
MARRPHWTLDDIPYGEIDRDAIAGDRCVFHLIASASFIEISSDAYTRNLVEYCSDEPEVVGWLKHGWEGEEVQHGLALRRYVETVWPEFDWERAYNSFMTEYARLCSLEFYAPTRALEMAARCVVETGTSSFYRMLADASHEPVLRKLATFISNDEIDHYKHFYRYFRLYAVKERPSRWAIAKTLLARIAEVDNEDAAIAFKHVRLETHPDTPYSDAEYEDFRRFVRTWGMPHYKFDRAVRMVLKPMRLPGALARVAEQVGVGIARRRLCA